MKLLKSEKRYECSVFSVEERTYEYQDRTLTRSVVLHPGAVIIIPEAEEGDLYLVKQFRQAVGAEILEFPAGTLESAEDPKECAFRELQEECGVQADVMISLGTLFPTPGFCNEIQHVYLARGLKPSGQNLDEDEIIEPKRIERRRILELLSKESTYDGKTLAALTLYLRYLTQSESLSVAELQKIFC